MPTPVDEHPTRPRRGLPPPERRRRGDLVAAALIAVVALVVVVVVVASGDAVNTELRTASPPLSAPPPGPVPVALAEAWRAASPATVRPVVVGPAVVTGGPGGDGAGGDSGGGTVVGHDPVTGVAAWSYTRPEPVCTVSAAFDDALAVFRVDSPVGTFCAPVAALDAASGARGPARDADVRPGTALISDDSHVVATGADYLEVWRSDLVATLEYGRLPTPVQSDPQPRAGCAHASVALADDAVGVLERCPGETSDRLSLLDVDPSSADEPTDRLSTLTGIVGGRLVAVTDDRAAIAAPDGTLRVLDASGTGVETVPLGLVAGPTTDPPGHDAGVRPVDGLLLWWTGTGTVALDPTTLLPRWVLPGTLGAGAAVPADSSGPTTLLVPTPGALLAVDSASGAVRGAVGVDRSADGGPAPVAVATIGTTVLEQRGATVVALRPPR